MEVKNILSDLIKLNTTNHLKNEKIVVDYIKAICDKYQITYEEIVTDTNRSNLIVTIGIDKEDYLIFMGHTDVVDADKNAFSIDPFNGEIRDGFVNGRGALDMKYMIASMIKTMIALKERETDLDKGAYFIFTADEENGSEFGMKALLKDPKVMTIFENKIVINEGGGFGVNIGEDCYYMVETGQKSIASLTIEIDEIPNTDPYFPTLSHENVVVKVLERIENLFNGERYPKTIEHVLSKVMPLDKCPKIESMASKIDEKLLKLFMLMSKSIVTPVSINGGSRNPLLDRNKKGSIDFDCRLLPYLEKEVFLDELRRALKGLGVTIKLNDFQQGYELTDYNKMLGQLELLLKEQRKEIKGILPFITPGSNDGRFLQPLGCEIYGFAPLDLDMPFVDIMPFIHGIDEKISVQSLEFCEKMLTELALKYCKGVEL